MKNVTFKLLSITNFLSIGKEIKIPLTKNGIHIITGYNLDREDQNGVGKSAIIDAFFYALFGETLKDLKKEQIVNDIAKKNCKVVLDFDIDKNGTITSYRIERGAAPSFCKVFIDNKQDETLSTIPATNNYILNLINSTSTVFRNTITMGINNSIAFMSQKKNEKRDFIEGILRLELFKIMNKVAKENYDIIFKDYEFTIKTHEETVRNIQLYIERKNTFEKNRIEKIEYLLKRKAQFETDIVDLEKSLIKIDMDAYNNILANLQTYTKNLQEKETEYRMLNKTLVEAETTLQHYQTNCETISNKSKILKEQYEQCSKIENNPKTVEECRALIEKTQNDIEIAHSWAIEINRDIKDGQAKIKQIGEIGSFCDKCKRPFPENDVKKNEEEIKHLQATIETNELNLVRENARRVTLKESIVQIEKTIQNIEAITKIKEQVVQLSNEKKQYTDDNEKLTNKICVTKELIENIEKERSQLNADSQHTQIERDNLQSQIYRNTGAVKLIENTKSNVQNCKDDIKKAETEKNEFEDLVNSSTTKKIELEKQIEEYKEKVAIYDVIKFVVSDEGVKSYIIKKLLGILNERINYYLVKMDANCKLVFNEFFEDQIINDKKNECSYDNFSGGERKRIDLACLFAFMDLRRIQGDVTFNLAFYDELLDSALSANGSEKVFNILKERMDNYNEAAYIVTHKKENLKNPLITDVIYLEKSGGITKLAEYKT